MPADAPNRFIINIQPEQRAGVGELLTAAGIDAELLPMIRARLTRIGERTVSAADYPDDERAQRLVERNSTCPGIVTSLSATSSPPAAGSSPMKPGRDWPRSRPSGQDGYETPVGVFSILQKNAVHYSNLYDDASMPYMQRITWSGVALHAGALPGYPASHGCVRLPYEFAEKIFSLTKLGMRVVISRDDIAPVDFSHRLLLRPEPVPEMAVAIPTAYDPDSRDEENASLLRPDVSDWPARQKLLDTLRAEARDKAETAATAVRRREDLSADLKSRKKELSLISKRDQIEKLVAKAQARVAKAIQKLAEEQSFYNPLHHPEFDEDHGRRIYFEGTYTNSFTNSPATPQYNYNQLMYRLDLDSKRIREVFSR